MEGVTDGGRLSGQVTVGVRVVDPLHYNRRRFTFLVDGRVVDEGKEWQLDPEGLAAGEHTIRAVAYTYGMMRSQSFAEVRVTVGE